MPKAKTGKKSPRRRGHGGKTSRRCQPRQNRAGQGRVPDFTLTREQVIAKCRAKKRSLICAGQVLALMALMKIKGWTAHELAGRSGVSRSMISGILNLERFPTTVVLRSLCFSMGLKLHEFDLLAEYMALE